MKTFNCTCGTELQADGEDNLHVVVKRHAAERHGGDPMFSDMELEAQIALVAEDDQK